MTRQPIIAQHAEELLGHSVVATAPIAGGDTATATKLRLSDGTTAIMKTVAHAPDGFFAAEADGLRWLGEVTDDGGVAVPEVLALDEGCLILRWVESGKASADVAGSFGQALAATHAAGAARLRRRPRRLHLVAPDAQPRRRHVGGVLRRAAGAPLPQAGPGPRSTSPATTPPRSRRSSACSPTCCPSSRRPGCTATSGTATSSGGRTAASG